MAIIIKYDVHLTFALPKNSIHILMLLNTGYGYHCVGVANLPINNTVKNHVSKNT